MNLIKAFLLLDLGRMVFWSNYYTGPSAT